ncbi:MAG: hypothetical protein AVDCRST_MAG13-291, partial [uncultured Solirubrobacteraceae bacterium]
GERGRHGLRRPAAAPARAGGHAGHGQLAPARALRRRRGLGRRREPRRLRRGPRPPRGELHGGGDRRVGRRGLEQLPPQPGMDLPRPPRPGRLPGLPLPPREPRRFRRAARAARAPRGGRRAPRRSPARGDRARHAGELRGQQALELRPV